MTSFSGLTMVLSAAFWCMTKLGHCISARWYGYSTPVLTTRTGRGLYALTALVQDTAIISNVVTTFEPTAIVADWNDLKSALNSGRLTLGDFYRQAGLLNRVVDSGWGVMLTRGGQRYWMTNEQYLIQRFDGGAPGSFLVHDQVGTLCLGSSYGFSGPVLAKLSTTLPTITVQPHSQSVTAGATATFSVTATGSPLLSYQWRKNGANIAAATNSTLTITNTQSGNTGALQCASGRCRLAYRSVPARCSRWSPATTPSAR